MQSQALHCPGDTQLLIFNLERTVVQVAAGVLARIMDAAEQPSASFEVWLQCIEWLYVAGSKQSGCSALKQLLVTWFACA